MLGLFDLLNVDVKVEMQSEEEFKTKLEKSVKRGEIVDTTLKAAEMENKRLERRNDDRLRARSSCKKDMDR